VDAKPERKKDRRTIYTETVIKDSLIGLMREKPFNKITVKELCARAEINRGTLYLHYSDLLDVLDEIENDVLDSLHDDLMGISTYDEDRLPLTQEFFDAIANQDLLSLLTVEQADFTHIIDKTIAATKGNIMPALKQNLDLSDAQAECLFVFLVNGCMAATRETARGANRGWNDCLAIIDRFIEGGYKNLTDEKELSS
jgi:AcrR family transcriptional regulator